MPAPEEYVRQDVLRTLVDEYGYPREALLVEEPVARGTMNRRRADVLVQLPRRGTAAAVLLAGSPSDKPSYPSYSGALEKVRALLPRIESVRFPPLPDTIELAVNGRELSCSVRGVFAEGTQLSLVLDHDETLADDVRANLPPELVIAVLGYGRTPEEVALSERLGLRDTPGTSPGSSALFIAVHSLLQVMGGELWVDDAISGDGDSGWVTIGRRGEGGPVLVHLDIGTGEWADFERAAYEQAPKLWLMDRRIAHRRRLDELEPGDRVYAQVTIEDEVLESECVVLGAADNGNVRVDFGNGGIVEVSPSIGEAGGWLLGRVGDDQVEPHPSDAENRGQHTFIVVECKAPNIALTEEVLQQGLDYVRARAARFLVLTNGTETRTFHMDGARPEEVDDIPDYAHAVSDQDYELARAPGRPEHIPLPDAARHSRDLVRLHGRYRGGLIGADLKPELWESVLLVDDLLRRRGRLVDDPHTAHGVTIVEDLGLHFHAPGNRAGGHMSGLFRDFRIRSDDHLNHVLGMMVAANAKTVGDPTWGNSRGKSKLVVALSDGAAYHQNLQLDLGRFVQEREGRLHLWHSGRMTAGAGGVKNARVLQHVADRQPSLVTGDRIQLGSIPARSSAPWDDLKDFVARVAAYVLARDELKREVRARRKKRG